MRIQHRVSVGSSPAVRAELAALGIDVAAIGFVSFQVDEGESWPALSAWVERRQAVDIVSTTFTRAELSGAPWLELVPDWHLGYPQPEDGYRAVVYDVADFCPACGVGGRQVAPFRMKAEPNWGRRGILQLNWVFGDFFVTPEVLAGVFAPLGIAGRPVLDRRGAAELRTVRQLDVTEIVDVDTAGLEATVCPACGRSKYPAPAAGPSPRPLNAASAALACSAQWFGSGAEAHRLVLLPQATAVAIGAAKLRGASLRPATGPQVRSAG